MEFTSGSFDFPSHKGSGPRSQTLRVAFDRRIGKASAVLTGYEAKFDSGDHELRQLVVSLHTRIVNQSTTGHEVEVTATFGLRDASGHWDDPYSGQVRFLLISVPENQRPQVSNVKGV